MADGVTITDGAMDLDKSLTPGVRRQNCPLLQRRLYGFDMPSGICIFCGEHTTLTREHVFSEPILGKLIGVNGDVGLSWTDDGSRELWAGAVGGKTPHDLTIDCVCSGCNNEWMSRLDGQFAGDVKWWAENPAARLGSPRLDVITRYLLKLLFVVAVGERMAQPHWIVGEGPEPEFIPLTMRADGQAVLAHCLDDLKLNVHIGVCAVPKQTLDLITLIPVSADFIPETSKVSRTNSGLAVTFRRVGLDTEMAAEGPDAQNEDAIRAPAYEFNTRCRQSHPPP